MSTLKTLNISLENWFITWYNVTTSCSQYLTNSSFRFKFLFKYFNLYCKYSGWLKLWKYLYSGSLPLYSQSKFGSLRKNMGKIPLLSTLNDLPNLSKLSGNNR